MPQTYSINDLERLTGIKAHTIRIWEKRYGLLAPVRTETNIRTYTDDDLRKILNVNTLLREGWKISHVSAMSTQELESEVWNTAKASRSEPNVYEIYVQALVSAALSFDEEWFETAYTEVTGRFRVSLTFQNVIGPFLERVGLMWTVVKLHPGQEHFASNLIRRKIFTAIDGLPMSQGKGKCLLFLPAWEEHEMGLLYAWYLFRSGGYQVIYLGQRVPIEALIQSMDVVNPDILLAFLVTEEKEGTINAYLQRVIKHFTGKHFYLATRPEVYRDISHPHHVRLLSSPDALMELL